MLEIELAEGKAGTALATRALSARQVITLYPFNYMRRLPLREGVTVGSSEGTRCSA